MTATRKWIRLAAFFAAGVVCGSPLIVHAVRGTRDVRRLDAALSDLRERNLEVVKTVLDRAARPADR